MILTLGSSRWAASQSVETSGSSVDDVMAAPFRHFVMAGLDPAIQLFRRFGYALRGQARHDDDAHYPFAFFGSTLLDRAAGIAPGGEAAADMRDRLQPHVLRGFGRQRRAHAAGAMKDEFLVALENRLGIGAGRIDPEFQHAAGAGERAGNPSVALDLPGIADIDDHDVVALRGLDGVGGAQGFDLRIGLVDQRLDAAVDGLGHFCVPPVHVIPGWSGGPDPESRIPGSMLRIARGIDSTCYRTSSFIAPSRPSIVIGNMRSENSRRMMVVDSE